VQSYEISPRKVTPLSPDARIRSSRSPHREAIKYRLEGSPLIGPEKRRKKAIRTKNCLSDSEFFSFRFFLSIAGIGQSSGSPFFGYFLWRSKESDCPRGISGTWQTNQIISSDPSLRSGRTENEERTTSLHQTLRYAQGERGGTPTFVGRAAALSPTLSRAAGEGAKPATRRARL